MAQISVMIDTVDKSMEVSIDGKKLKDVCTVTANCDGCYGPEMYLSITTHTKNDDETLRMVNQISVAGEKLVKEVVPQLLPGKEPRIIGKGK